MPPINFLGVLVAGIAGWLIGAVWYGVFAKPWMAALGWSEADMMGPDGKRRVPMGPMVIAFVAETVMALMLAGLMGHMGGASVRVGVISGALVWLGFVVTSSLVNNSFQRRKPMLAVIDNGHWLAVLLGEGIVLGLFG